jgi:predicted nucleic acid-binding protein
MASDDYLLDTNVLIYATLQGDPRHKEAARLLAAAGLRGHTVYVSAQNLAEMWGALTGPRTVPPDPPSVAEAKIASIAALPHVVVLPVDKQTVRRAAEIARRHGLVRQRYYDAQIAAVMLQHGIRRIFTENVKDFAGLDCVDAVNPFA